MTLNLAMITVDTTDALALGGWWAEQLGGEIEADNDGWFVVVAAPGNPSRLGFQKVERPTPGQNKLHLDLVADDVDAEVARLEAAGAEKVDTHTMGDIGWVTMADPDGNYFDVARSEG